MEDKEITSLFIQTQERMLAAIANPPAVDTGGLNGAIGDSCGI
jgi:hypothetical protein